MHELLWNLSKDYDIIIITGGFEDMVTRFLNKYGILDLIKDIFAIPTLITDDGKFKANTLPEEWGGPCKSGGGKLCKLSTLKFYLKSHKYEKIIYVGDGSNDLCPTLILGANDLVFPRQGYSLETKLKQNCVQAKILPWKTGLDIMKHI